MSSLNLSQNGPSITASYQKVVNATPSGPAASSPTYGIWAVFSVKAPLANAFQADSGKESVLSVQSTGEGELIDLIDEFSDGRIQFAFVKVKDPNTTLPKNALIAWCGEGVPERTKGYFTSHLNAVSKLLHGYHVQVTARSDRDLTPEVIVHKVADASGAKYGGGGSAPAPTSAGAPPPVASKPILPTKSFGAAGGFQPLASRTRAAPAQTGATDNDGWGDDAPPVTRSQLEKVAPAYQPTKVNLAQLQSQREPSKYQPPARPEKSSADVVSGGYQPIGKVDIAAIRRQAQESGTLKDDRPTVVKGAYEPIGKVDIAEIRRKAQGGPPPQPVPLPQPSADDDERPKSLADRSAAFTQAERITELPKPKVANKFGASSFTGTKAPTPGAFQSPSSTGTAPVASTSRTFADEGGKTPAQIWAEKKARERGLSGAADTQPPTLGGTASAIKSQPSGGWQSGYEGKKWDVQIPARTGGSGISEQRTGQDDPPQDEGSSASGGFTSIKDRFTEAPALNTATKPNVGARGVPMPGLPQRSAAPSVPAVEHQDLPPPPARPVPQEEEEEEPVEDPYPQGSPARIAMPVGRGAEPIEPFAPLPPRAIPTAGLNAVVDQRQEDEEEDEPERQADVSRAAAQEAAASTFGQAEDSRGAGAAGGREAIAQYDYTKDEDNELELHEGERIINIEMVDDDWWMGENSKGEKGLFPSNYVELLPESGTGGGAPAAATASHAAAHEEESAPAAAAPGGSGRTATAEYDYEAAEENELSFPDGAKITHVVSYMLSIQVPDSRTLADLIIRNSRMKTGGLVSTTARLASSLPTMSSWTIRLFARLLWRSGRNMN